MKTNKKNTGIKVNAGVKAGGWYAGNHARPGLRVTTGLKAGGTYRQNHNRLLNLA